VSDINVTLLFKGTGFAQANLNPRFNVIVTLPMICGAQRIHEFERM
jgi:hypothetical protein